MNEEGKEQAQYAVKKMRAWMPTIQGFARMLSRQDDITVELSSNTTATDGKKIWIQVPYLLAHMKDRHSKTTCGARDSDGAFVCEACKWEELVFAQTLHECCHVFYDSFTPNRPRQVEKIIDSMAPVLTPETLEAWKKRANDSSGMLVEVLGNVHPALWMASNAVEDARIERAVALDRAGTRKILYALFRHTTTSKQADENGVKTAIRDAHPYMQALVGVLAVANFDSDLEFLNKDVRHIVQTDVELQENIEEIKTIRSSTKSAVVGAQIAKRLAELGLIDFNEAQEGGSGGDGDEDDEGEGEQGSSSGSDGSGSESGNDEHSDGSGSESGDGEQGEQDGDTQSENSQQGDAQSENSQQGEQDSNAQGENSQPLSRELFDRFMGHEPGDDEPGKPEVSQGPPGWGPGRDTKAIPEQEFKSAVELTLGQEFFDSVSESCLYLREHRMVNGQWDSEVFGSDASQGWSFSPLPMSDILAARNQLRLAFTENMKHKKQPNLKAGRSLNRKVLGYRVPAGDPRVFSKRLLPSKKDWFVLIGLDVSGSTMNGLIADIKALGIAQANLLHDLGIQFAVYGHSGSRGVDLLVAKEPKETWGPSQKRALESFFPFGGNIDGHTLEHYRKITARVKAKDKMILYFTDGKLPAGGSPAEEVEILQKEIQICKRLGIRLVGMGVKNDSPKQFGLDTIYMSGQHDLPNAIQELCKRLQ